MSFLFRWHDAEKRIFHVQLIGRWTWQAYNDEFQTIAIPMLRTAEKPFFTLYTTDSPYYLPPHVLKELLKLKTDILPGQSLGVYLVGIREFATPIFEALKQLDPKIGSRYILVDTLEAALSAIETRLNPPPLP